MAMTPPLKSCSTPTSTTNPSFLSSMFNAFLVDVERKERRPHLVLMDCDIINDNAQTREIRHECEDQRRRPQRRRCSIWSISGLEVHQEPWRV